MRKMITLLALVAVIIGGLWLGLTKRKEIGNLAKEKILEAKGYEKAKTPQEAIDYFHRAIKERDYDTAARYCTADYAEQLKKGAEAANKLGKKIDDVRTALNNRGLNSDVSRAALALLEPFPPDFEVLELKKNGDAKAVAVIQETAVEDSGKGSKVLQWRFDLVFCRALAQGLGNPATIPLKLEGEGENMQWKIDIPVTGPMRTSVDRLNKKYMDYYNALNVVDQDVKTDATTKYDAEGRLKRELEKCLE
jgi:hypothetical protein